jgi:phosphatidylglycerophosphate synthase
MTLDRVRELARKRPEQEFFINRLYGAHLSPYFTVVCLRLGLSPDQVTLVGGAIGAVGVALLFLPVGAWSIVAILALQVGYILDFSDGQVARLTGRTSLAGAYLDWLTHFYIPVGAALATAASIAWSSGWFGYLVLGMLAALELGAFAFSCREHILVALGRQDPALAATAAYHAALADDARPADVLDAPAGPASGLSAAGISGRRHAPTWRSVIGELLIYPGAVHLLSVAVLVDLLLQVLGVVLPVPVSARGALVAAWAALLLVHAPIAIRRGHRVITAVEARAAGSGPAPAGSDRA